MYVEVSKVALIFKAGLQDAAPNTVAGVLNDIEAVLPSIASNYNLKTDKYKSDFEAILKEF